VGNEMGGYCCSKLCSAVAAILAGCLACPVVAIEGG
jgi:hypothetical protein